VVNHELGKLLAVNENDLVIDASSILMSILGKNGGSDKDTLFSMLALQRASKPLDLGPTDCILPSLGLNVDDI
jgi:hypothetical protein